MKLSPSNSAAKKIMRVASVAAGAAGLTAGFMPAQAALANSPVSQPYKIWVFTQGGAVSSIQVCGYKSVSGTGHWQCTVRQSVPFHASQHPAYMGSDWRRGEIKVFMWGWNLNGTAYYERSHTCNTNGAYYGHLRNSGVSLTHADGFALAMSTAAC